MRTQTNKCFRSAKISPSSLLAIMAVMILIVLGAFLFIPKKPITNGDPPPKAKITPEQATKYLKLARVAHGYLEDQNQDAGRDESGTGLNGFLEAEKRYIELAEALPTEPMPTRNLAITQTMYLIDGGIESGTERKSRAATTLATIERLKNLEPNSALPYVLSASIRTAINDNTDGISMDENLELAIADLEKAVEL